MASLKHLKMSCLSINAPSDASSSNKDPIGILPRKNIPCLMKSKNYCKNCPQYLDGPAEIDIVRGFQHQIEL